MFRRLIPSTLLLLLVLVLTLPVLAIILSWTQLDRLSWDILREMGRTVLPDYVSTTVLLCLSAVSYTHLTLPTIYSV